MKSVSTFLLAAFVGTGALSIAKSAWALGPVDLEIAAKAGVATRLVAGDGPDPLVFGIGGRAGVSIFSTLYAGVTGMYYIGASQSVAGGTVSDHAVQYGVEAGYNIYLLKLVGLTPDLVAKLITLRPQIGVGNLTVTTDTKGFVGIPNASGDNSNLYLEPGLTALANVGPLIAGLDVNALWLPNLANSKVALTAHAELGLKF